MLAPHAQPAHPSEEHFIPLLIAMGASVANDSVNVLAGGVDHSVLSMEPMLGILNKNLSNQFLIFLWIF